MTCATLCTMYVAFRKFDTSFILIKTFRFQRKIFLLLLCSLPLYLYPTDYLCFLRFLFCSLSGFSVFSEEPSNIRFICFFFFRGFCLQRKTLAMFYCFLVIFFSLKLFCQNNLSDMGRRTFVKFSALIHHYLKFYKSFFPISIYHFRFGNIIHFVIFSWPLVHASSQKHVKIKKLNCLGKIENMRVLPHEGNKCPKIPSTDASLG